MKAKITLVCLMLLIGGCVSVEGSGWKYHRLGNMEASDIVVNIDPNGIAHIEVGKLNNTGFDAFVKALSDAYKAGMEDARQQNIYQEGEQK